MFIALNQSTGDGTGVGKTRILAGICRLYYYGKKCKKILWISVSTDLAEDAQAALAEVKAKEIPFTSTVNYATVFFLLL